MPDLGKISKLLYNTFITNDSAMAVQTDTGYRTIETQVTPEIIQYMLQSKASIAVYQQATYKNTLRWICFDFDCLHEELLATLYSSTILPFTQNLTERCIPYILEFSGRRGFHIWIILDRMISKCDGYHLLLAIENTCIPRVDNNESLYKLDRFPATSGGHNKYGKAVKIPLSFHKKGHYSQMILPTSDYCILPVANLDDTFIMEQCRIIEGYAYANYDQLKKQFALDVERNSFDSISRIAYSVDSPISLESFMDAAKGSSVLELISRHILTDALTHLDRSVLVGLLSHVTGGKQILHNIMATQSNYDEKKTEQIINEMSSHYYSLRFGQLYSYYNSTLEESLDPKVSVIEWLLDKMGMERHSITVDSPKQLQHWGLEDIVRKEQNYQLFNDEVVDVLILRDLQRITAIDLARISSIMERVESDESYTLDTIIYETATRIEAGGRKRILFAQSAFDRILTTALAFRFSELYTGSLESYSYHINRAPGGDVFYPWLSSWNRYRKAIATYLSIPLFSEFHLVKIDIHHFYDSIRLNALFDKCVQIIERNSIDSTKAHNIFAFLVKYNARLMMLEGFDHGVPQGPAYARILAEFFISSVINQFYSMAGNQFGKIKLFRYVDDIFVFLEPHADPDSFLQLFSYHMEENHLYLNKEKTRIWGKVKDINLRDINDLCDRAAENYKLQSFSNLDYFEEDDLIDPLATYDAFLSRNGEWDIKDANFLLNNSIDPFLSNMYLKQFGSLIIKSEIGRGSIFRKYYSLVFSNPEKFTQFFSQGQYANIPTRSLNMSNMISTLYLAIKRDSGVLLDAVEPIITMCKFLQTQDLLPCDASSVNAILEFLQARE